MISLKLILKITALIIGIFSNIFQALYCIKLELFLGLNLEAEIQILNSIYLYCWLPGQTTKTALTEEFMFQNVAYRPTVYITGVL